MRPRPPTFCATGTTFNGPDPRGRLDFQTRGNPFRQSPGVVKKKIAGKHLPPGWGRCSVCLRRGPPRITNGSARGGSAPRRPQAFMTKGFGPSGLPYAGGSRPKRLVPGPLLPGSPGLPPHRGNHMSHRIPISYYFYPGGPFPP